MTTIFNHFDNSKTAFINPTDVITIKPDFPEVCISTYSETIINSISKLSGVKEIANMYSANGVLPIYEIEYGGKKVAFFLSRVGAPACAAGLEEIIALGAKKLVLFGSGGILNEEKVEDKIVVPISAVRDEGTSYHYFPASDEIFADNNCVKVLIQCLDNCGFSYVIGKTWTTDAIYRETPYTIEKRKKQGCLVVEMESSAAFAVAQFRDIPLIQFLYGADSLDCPKWEQRDLLAYGIENCIKYVKLAFECAAHL